MDETRGTLRLDLDGSWWASHFGEFFVSVSDLYNLRLLLQVMVEDVYDLERAWDEFFHFPPMRKRARRLRRIGPFLPGFSPLQWSPAILTDSRTLLRASSFIYPNEQLTCQRVRLESPGFTDLAGIGVISGHVKDFIVRVIEIATTHKQRDLRNQLLESQVLAQRIQNARELVSLADDLGLDQSEIRELVGFVDRRQDVVLNAANSRLLTRARMLEGDNDA